MTTRCRWLVTQIGKQTANIGITRNAIATIGAIARPAVYARTMEQKRTAAPLVCSAVAEDIFA